MRTRFTDMLKVELMLLGKRPATWVIFGIWATVSLVFGYVLPYVAWRSGSTGGFNEGIDGLLPPALATTMGDGIPFYGGSLALILGVLAIGSEFGWGMWKTLFTQRPGRSGVFGTKIAALGILMVPFTLMVYALGAIASVTVALVEGVTIAWPPAQVLLESVLSGWLILAVWAAAGVALAVLTRGTSLAIGIGILWALALEGLLGAFANSISWMEGVAGFLLRANGYSLVRAVTGEGATNADGPGTFSGPYVSGAQAAIVLVSYLAIFLGGSLYLMRKRDVT
jgi:ABC-2 type transport system permease protein